MLPSLPPLDRDAKDDCLRVNSELIHSQWQIWQRPNPREQSLQPWQPPAVCYRR